MPSVFLGKYFDLHMRPHRKLNALVSVSGDPDRRDDVFSMGNFLEDELKKYGVDTKRVDLGTQTVEGVQLALPPLVLGRIGDDPSKKTLLIYGHFDVQPVRDKDHGYCPMLISGVIIGVQI